MNKIMIVHQVGTRVWSEEDWTTEEGLIKAFFKWINKTYDPFKGQATLTASRTGWTVRVGDWYSPDAFTATGLMPDEIRLAVQKLIAPPPPHKDVGCYVGRDTDGDYTVRTGPTPWDKTVAFKTKRAAKRFARREKKRIDSAWDY